MISKFFILFMLSVLTKSVTMNMENEEHKRKYPLSIEQTNTSRIVYPSEDTNLNRRQSHVSFQTHVVVLSFY